MKRLLLPVLPCLLGSCALLGALPGAGPREPAPPPSAQPTAAQIKVAQPTAVQAPSLRAQAEATGTAQGITVSLTLLNVGERSLTLRYAAQVNWGACGLPPSVALSRGGGTAVAPPVPAGRLTCPELQFTRTLAPRQSLTLRRTLPSLPPGSYTLTAWFDGEVSGEPVRVEAPAVVVAAP